MYLQFNAMRLYHFGLIILISHLLTACAPRVQIIPDVDANAYLGQEQVITADGKLLPLSIWLPQGEARAVILGIHGFNDYRNAFSLPAPYFSAHGVAFYAYDQRGFGATDYRGIWPGKDTLIADLLAVIKLLKSRHPGVPLYVLGDSMGGAVALVTLSEHPTPLVDGLILNAPAVWGSDTFNPLYRALLWVFAHTVPWYEVTGEGFQVTISDNNEVLEQISRDPLMIRETRFDVLYGLVHLMDDALTTGFDLTSPVLVLYGLHDEVIPRRSICRLMNAFGPQQQTVFYPNGYHLLLRDLQAETVWRDILAWINGQNVATPMSVLEQHCNNAKS